MAAPAPVTITPLDVAGASEDERRAAYALFEADERELFPHDRPPPYGEWLEQRTSTLSFRRDRLWIATAPGAGGGDGELVGYAETGEDLSNNTHVTGGWIHVVPTHRRRGIGTQLLRTVVEHARAHGRTSLLTHALERDGAGHSHNGAASGFLARYGLTPRIREHVNRLRVADIDRALLESWVTKASERASDYELVGWDGPTPEDRIERVARLLELINTAPTEDLDWEYQRYTPERVRERERELANRGEPWWTLTAVHKPTGEPVAYTHLYFSKWREELARQGGTAVDPAHRDKGIGRWIKAANLIRLLDERPAVERVDTGNAGSNDAMLNINHAIGFRAVGVWIGHQNDVDVVAKHLDDLEDAR